jgi:hypothetical protein
LAFRLVAVGVVLAAIAACTSLANEPVATFALTADEAPGSSR